VVVLGVAVLVAVVAGGVAALGALLWARVEGDPERVGVIGPRAAALAALGSAALFLLLWLLVRSGWGFSQIDLSPTRWVARRETPTSTSVLRLLTWLGSSAFCFPLSAVVGLAELRRWAKWSVPGFIVLVEGGQWLLHNVLKVLVDRARPDIHQLTHASGLSFPSGHATNAAATYAAVAVLLGTRRGRTTRVTLGGTAGALAALVAATRVLLGVHWVTDVLGGLVLGFGWAAACTVVLRGPPRSEVPEAELVPLGSDR